MTPLIRAYSNTGGWIKVAEWKTFFEFIIGKCQCPEPGPSSCVLKYYPSLVPFDKLNQVKMIGTEIWINTADTSKEYNHLLAMHCTTQYQSTPVQSSSFVIELLPPPCDPPVKPTITKSFQYDSSVVPVSAF
jgi:hypothetical protein